MTTSTDERIEAQRATARRFAATAKRFGYFCVAASVVFFVVGLFTDFGPVITWGVGISLLLSALALVPAVIIGYGVSMAEHEEQGIPFRH